MYNAKMIKTPLLLMLMMCFGILAYGQPNLPRKSPKASTSYTVGLTDITVAYSSPSVNGRAIWGELEAWDKLWRAGANEATTIEFSTDAVIEGQPLPKGKYSFFVIPKETGKWTVIFNKIADQWGAYQYDEKQDALRVDIAPKMVKVSEERLSYRIVDQGIDKGYIRLGWEKMRLYVRFRVKYLDEAIASVEAAVAGGGDKVWTFYAQGAEFLLDAKKEMKKAQEWADKSTELFGHSWNWWIKAQVDAANGDYKSAVASAAKSAEMAAANEKDRFYDSAKTEIENAVTEWKSKS
ncbi:MAG: DUF2911 domain-containing protein [Bacteroidota bacterium]